MRKNFGAQTWLYPMPVLMIGTYDAAGNADMMNAAWGGICNSNQIAICIDKSHKTAKNLAVSGAFTVSIGDASLEKECDFLGLVSGNQEPDKLQKAGLHFRKSEFVNAPFVEEFPFTLECRLIRYGDDELCIGEIMNVSADEKILGPDGKISLDLFAPICFDPVRHTYYRLGPVAGTAFHDGMNLK